VDKAGIEHEELAHNIDGDYSDFHNFNDENSRLKQNIEELRAVTRN
jgi:cell division septum initiation protein DivIVA